MSPNRNVRGAAQAAVRVGLGLALVAMIAVIPASSARATASYALVASGAGTTTTDTARTLGVTFRKDGKAVAKATALLQRQDGEAWVTEATVAISKGKGSTKVRHPAGDVTYRFLVENRAATPAFVVHFAPTSFTLTGSGAGHGVGLSQYGAYQLARQGSSAADILRYYYPGARPGVANNPSGTVKVQVLGPPADSRRSTKIMFTDGFRVLDGDGRHLFTTTGRGTLAIGVRGTKVTAKATRSSGTSKKLPKRARLHLLWEPGTVTVAGAQGSYRDGSLWVSSLKARPNVVNELVLNTEYLHGIDEMPASWAADGGAEALRAQVVAARTYALLRVIRARTSYPDTGELPECGCHLYDDPRSQNFTGWKKAGDPANLAWVDAVDVTVRASASQPNGSEVDILRDGDGGFAETPYFASSGSYLLDGVTWSGTAGNAEAFGTTALPYLSHVADPYSAAAPGNPALSWTRSLTQARAREVFGTGDAVATITVVERYPGGLLKTVRATSVTGQVRERTASAEALRAAFGLPGAWVATVSGA